MHTFKPGDKAIYTDPKTGQKVNVTVQPCGECVEGHVAIKVDDGSGAFGVVPESTLTAV